MATELREGDNTSIDTTRGSRIDVTLAAAGATVDAFGILTTGGRAIHEDAVVFFNRLAQAGVLLDEDSNTFQIDTTAIPADVDRIVVAIAIDEKASPGATMSALSSLQVSVDTFPTSGQQITFEPSKLRTENAAHLVEIYKRAGAWKARAIGQGWTGGISELLKDHGIGVKKEAATTAPRSPSPLEKRIREFDSQLARTHPGLVDLTKNVDSSLRKLKLTGHRAHVALMIDNSKFMEELLRSGGVDHLAKRLAAIASRFDDDGKLDIFTFNWNGGFVCSASLTELPLFDASFMSVQPTVPARAGYSGSMNLRDHYFGTATASHEEPLPVFAIFLTNEELVDPTRSRQILDEVSPFAMFQQFVGVGTGGFQKLRDLNNQGGGVIDAAGFVTFPNFKDLPDQVLVEGVLNEYPEYLTKAKDLTIIAQSVATNFGL